MRNSLGKTIVDVIALLGAESVYLVPVVVLVAAGTVVVSRSALSDPLQGFVDGITIAIGYLPITVIALLGASTYGVGPTPLRALVIAGVVYPVAAGGIGGAVTTWVRTR